MSVVEGSGASPHWKRLHGSLRGGIDWAIREEVLEPLRRPIRFVLLGALSSAFGVGHRRAIAKQTGLTVTQFVTVILTRFATGLGQNVRFSSREYLNFNERVPPPHYQSPWSPALYLADVFRAQGFFECAEAKYRSAARWSRTAYDARCGLGDLLLAKGQWAQEFRPYGESGESLDPWRILQSNKREWRQAGFDEAITVLSRAHRLRPSDERAPWLLTLIFIATERRGDAIEQFKVLEPLIEPWATADRNHLRLRVTFPLDPEETIKFGNEEWLRGWRDKEGFSWSVASFRFCRGDEVPEANDIVKREVGVATELGIATGLVYQRQIREYRSRIGFSPSYCLKCSMATFLPINGTVLAGGAYLLTDSLHHREVHMEVFSPEVKRLANGSALIVAPEEVEYHHDNTTFIGYNANYYHWLIEELPRLSLVIQAGMLEDRSVLVDQDAREWQLELLRRFGIANDRMRRVDFRRFVKVRNVVVPSRLSTNGVAHPEAVAFVRETLLRGHPGSCRPGKRLYVTRDTAPGRSMLNADEISSQFQRAGFISVNPSYMSIDQQIDIFSDAEVIAGPAGAGLANAVFAPSNARLIQLAPTDSCWETFTSLAAAAGQSSFWCLGRGFARPYKRWIWTEFDFVVDPDDIDICLDRML